MLRYVARRLLQMVPVFFGATLLIYAMVFALPGDPISALGGQRSLSPEVIDQIKASYHLDKPFIVQYLLYLRGLLTLDLGQSLRGTESVLDVLPGSIWPAPTGRYSARGCSPPGSRRSCAPAPRSRR